LPAQSQSFSIARHTFFAYERLYCHIITYTPYSLLFTSLFLFNAFALIAFCNTSLIFRLSHFLWILLIVYILSIICGFQLASPAYYLLTSLDYNLSFTLVALMQFIAHSCLSALLFCPFLVTILLQQVLSCLR